MLDLLVSERVTLTAGVPTVWLGVLQELDENPGKYDLSACARSSSAAAPRRRRLIRGFEERHGLTCSTPGA